MGTFVPLLLTSFLTFYDLNVIIMKPGSVITIDTTLEAALKPELIDEAGTKVNELLAVFFACNIVCDHHCSLDMYHYTHLP